MEVKRRTSRGNREVRTSRGSRHAACWRDHQVQPLRRTWRSQSPGDWLCCPRPELRVIAVDDHDVRREAEIYVTGLAGFPPGQDCGCLQPPQGKGLVLHRHVLLNNDHGDPVAAARRAWHVFGTSIAPAGSALRDLKANFADSTTGGTTAYAGQVSLDHPDGRSSDCRG